MVNGEYKADMKILDFECSGQPCSNPCPTCTIQKKDMEFIRPYNTEFMIERLVPFCELLYFHNVKFFIILTIVAHCQDLNFMPLSPVLALSSAV